MKIIISESQQKLISDQFAPYPTEIEYQQKDPNGYNRSEKYGLLDLYYPNRHQNPIEKTKNKSPKLSMMNIITPKANNRPKSYKNKRWTPEALKNEAKKYNSRGEFLKNNAPAYVISLRIPRFMEKMYGPKKSQGNRIWKPNLKKNITTDVGEITMGSWVSTNTEDFKVISLAKNKIIGQSFCNPNKKIELHPQDIVDINTSGRDKFDDLKMDFSKYYQEAGLTEMVKGRELYKGGSNMILFLDDSRNPFTSKEDWIKKYSQIGTDDIHVKHITTYNEFVHHITNYGMPKQIIFDHDLGKTNKQGGSGCNSAAWLVKYCLTNKRRLPKWSISSANKYGRCCIGNVLRKFEELTDDKSEV